MRIALITAGALGIAYAIVGALTDPDLKPLGAAVFLAAVLIAHDAVLMPIVLAAGSLLKRVPPPIRVALIISLATGVVALPLMLGGDPSVAPRHYGAGLAAVLAVVWTAALVVIVRRRIR